MARSLRSLWVLLALASVPVSASAQDTMDCRTDPRGPIEVSPASGANAASLDAPVLVRYGAGYFGPDGPGDPPSTLFQLVTCGDCSTSCDVTTGTAVPGLVQTAGDDLLFLPDGGFSAQTRYAGHVTGIDNELDFNFCTGSRPDTAPPSAAIMGEPTSAHIGAVACLPSGGYRIQVYFPPASDDGPPGSIEYLLFQTRGHDISAPVLVDRVRNFQTDRITMSFLIADADVGAPICLQVVTVDGDGHATVPVGDRCFDPVGHVTFQGCATSPSRRGNGLLGLASIGALVLVARRRKR